MVDKLTQKTSIDGGIDAVLEAWAAVVRSRRVIAAVTLGVALAAVAVAFLLPVEFAGTARILPPQQQQSSAAMLLSQVSALAGLQMGGAALKDPGELYVGMLKSRTVLDRIIERFKLKERYDNNTLVETREALLERVDIFTRKDSLIEINVLDRDARTAADMANAFVEEWRRRSEALVF
jgi:tyrosine-protein kinase Etk/Wzc